MHTTTMSDRRSSRLSAKAHPTELVNAQLDVARRQLAMARESLIAARRRVVALEEAVANWTEFSRAAAGLTRSRPR